MNRFLVASKVFGSREVLLAMLNIGIKSFVALRVASTGLFRRTKIRSLHVMLTIIER